MTLPFDPTGYPGDPPSGPINCVTAPEPLDPVHPTGPEPLYFVTHDNLPERKGWWAGARPRMAQGTGLRDRGVLCRRGA